MIIYVKIGRGRPGFITPCPEENRSMKITQKTKSKKPPKKGGGSAGRRKNEANSEKIIDAFNKGGASFYFTTQEIEIIKFAVKNSLLIEAEDLEEINITKTPVLNIISNDRIRDHESILNKLIFNE